MAETRKSLLVIIKKWLKRGHKYESFVSEAIKRLYSIEIEKLFP